MGYQMFQLESHLLIKREKAVHALEAVKSLQGREMRFMWLGPSEEFTTASSLEEALQVWRWPVVDEDDEGNILNIEFIGEKYGDEDLLFSVLAPYVEPGSYITMAGEDRKIWRWYFTGEVVEKQFGRVVFDAQTEQTKGGLRTEME